MQIITNKGERSETIKKGVKAERIEAMRHVSKDDDAYTPLGKVRPNDVLIP